MTGGAIRTKRLTLRPLRPEDAPAVTDGIARWDVIQWLSTPPWPYALADAEAFLAAPASAGSRGIELDGRVIGVVHLGPARELGYWLHPDFHGQGIMSEAASAVVAAHFDASNEAIWSGHLPGNAASARVLAKLAFRYTAPVQRPHKALGRDVTIERMELTEADWSQTCAS